MRFSIDGQESDSYVANVPSTVHHEALWSSPTLSDSSHTLVMTQDGPMDTNGGVIFLDYFLYNASASTVSEGKTLFIDDRDPRIIYDANWRLFGSDPDFQHTTHGKSQRFLIQLRTDC